jgi:large subunit ribosomal protein L25
MLELAVKQREKLGKKARQVRKSGAIPGILYGYGMEPSPVEVSAKEFAHVWKEAGETSLVSLMMEKGAKHSVLINDVSRDVLLGTPMHVDFYAVRLDRPIEADIPLVFIGESEAVKALNGVLVKVAYELAIRALPKDLPHEIEVDISPLKTFDDQLFVKDIPLPAGVEAMADPEQALVLVEAPRTEEELAAMEQPAEVSLEGIEVAGAKEKTDETEEESASDK